MKDTARQQIFSCWFAFLLLDNECVHHRATIADMPCTRALT